MEFLFLSSLGEEYANAQDLKDLSSKDEVFELLSEAHFAGSKEVLEAISLALEKITVTGSLVSFRNDFYKVYNLHFGHIARPNQVLTMGTQRWEARWVNENPSGESKCFWTVQQSVLNDTTQQWDGVGGGSLLSNPQTDREVRLALLTLASQY